MTREVETVVAESEMKYVTLELTYRYVVTDHMFLKVPIPSFITDPKEQNELARSIAFKLNHANEKAYKSMAVEKTREPVVAIVSNIISETETI